MSPRTLFISLVAAAAFPCVGGAAVIVGAPPGGSISLHDSSFAIDVNADGIPDLTVIDQPAYGSGSNNIVGSWIEARQALTVGVYRGTGTGEDAVALNAGDQVGANGPDDFVYSLNGLGSEAIIQWYYEQNQIQWIDGAKHFMGIDVPSGSDHHYGWVELSLKPSTAPTSAGPWYDVTVDDWAYDTTANQPITVPEPAPLTILGMMIGGAALTLPRRKMN